MSPGARAAGKRRRYPKSRSCCMACWNAVKRDFVLLPAHKHADAPHPLRLLRMRRQRPCCAPPRSDMSSRRLMGSLPCRPVEQVENIAGRLCCASQQNRASYFRIGSKREVRLFGLMSASAGSSGHNDANGLPPECADFVTKVFACLVSK